MCDKKTEKVNIEKKLIVFDSNVWLDMYKLPPPTIQTIVNSISESLENFWLPNQVYIEFNRHLKKNRDFAVMRFENLKRESASSINDVKNLINQEFMNLKNNDIFDVSEVQDSFNIEVKKLAKGLKFGLEKLDKEYKKEVNCILPDNDVIQELIEELRKESKTTGFNISELLSIYEEGETRFKYNIPPGVTDATKEKNEDIDSYLARKYGDLVIWKEILSEASRRQIDIIFVENEKKADWWETRGSKKMSRVLLDEFVSTTNKQSIVMVRLEDFLETYGEELGLPSQPIKEIVAKANFVKSVKKNVSENISEFVSDIVQEEFLDTDLLDEELMESSIFGGTFESCEYAELTNLKVIDFQISFNQEWDDYSINCDVEFEFNLDVNEYVQRHVSHQGMVEMKALLSIETSISIDFTDLNIDIEKAITNTYSSFIDFQLIDYSYDDFSVEVDVDEDMFRDR